MSLKVVALSNSNKDDSSKTKGVETLLGEPKKAILKLAIPMIIAMSAHTVYNLVDALWVSGFGKGFFTSAEVSDIGIDALAAVGFAMPFFMMLISISVGIGVGSGSAISRRIGAKDKKGADNVAIHSIIITLILAFVFSAALFLSADRLFTIIGAEKSASMAISYGRIIFAGTIFLFFTNIAFAILRSEGDARRAMYAMMIGAGTNIVLDPIFIFTFGFGVSGAAYATVLAMSITSFILVYWLFFRKDTYVTIKFNKFKFNKEILKDIFKVGLPASVQQLSMSITMIAIIIIINVTSGGENFVAVYNTGWRVVMIAILPLLGMATAVVSVTGAAFGARAYDKLNTAYMYAAKSGFIIEIILAIIIFLLAPLISIIFTSRPEDVFIRNDLTMFLQISCFFYPGAAFGISSSAMFQGTGKGIYALIATLLRTIVFTILLALISTFILNAGVVGIWWSIVIANLAGSMISFTWGLYYIKKLKLKNSASS
ncbi:MATE family efflux transporter [Thermoplasmatales archaeon SG8-52-2]|nr:MAG: MATE family efflux transporter [Thermoplasmatales archaeon SG8-52-2]